VKSAGTDLAASAALARLQPPSRRSPESGYVYFMVLFLMVMMITASTTVMLDMRTQGRRQREEEVIWRGKEFVRAIKLYYHKTGRFPQNLDDLEKGVANIHFLRQEALTDPMNKDGDGKWRFIYTNQAGQIIGSVHYATMQQMAILDMYGGKLPGLQGSEAGSDQDTSSTASTSSASPSGQSDQNQQGQGSTSSSSNTNCPQAPLGAPGLASSVPGLQISGGLGANTLGASLIQSQPLQIGPGSPSPLSSSSQSQVGSGTCPTTTPIAGLQLAALQALMNLKPTGPVDSPVIGGFVVGVGSTVDRKSVRIYKNGKKYNEWEFIWNPMEEQALALQQGLNQPGAGAGVGPLGQPIGLGSQSPGPGTTGGAGPVQAPPTELPQPPQTQQQ
jgi:hypothetical protein